MRTVFIVLMSFLCLASCTAPQDQDTNAFALVPKDVGLVFQYNDHENLLKDMEGHAIVKALKKISASKRLAKKLEPLGFIKNKNKGLLLLSAPASRQLDFAYISQDSVMELTLDSLPNKTIETLEQQETAVQKIQVDSLVFYQQSVGGYPVISSSIALLKKMEETYRQGDKSHIPVKFMKAFDSRKAGHLMLNLKHTDHLTEYLFGAPLKTPLSSFADWLSLDVSLDNNTVLLSGVATVGMGSNTFLGKLKGFSQTGRLQGFVPKSVRSFSSYGLGNFHRYLEKDSVALQWPQVTRDSIFDSTEEVGLANTQNGRVVFLGTYGASSVWDYLNYNGAGTKEYQGSQILSLNGDPALDSLLTGVAGPVQIRFASVLENTVVLAENENALQDALRSYRNGETFNTSVLWQNAAKALTPRATSTKVMDTDGLLDFLAQEATTGLAREFADLELQNPFFASQLIAEDGYFHVRYVLGEQSKTLDQKDIQRLFGVALDADLALPPQFVLNHRTGKKEVVVQDRENVLYLISTSGTVLWKKPLNGPIQGKIHQVDIFKNGKWQMAFTTDSEFLILDRNGKEVSPFNIKYEGGNLNGLSVFDYAGNKDYRFVVTQGKKVHMYNNRAQIVKGFKYTQAEDDILAPPQHFRMGTRDYLVFKLKNGHLQILNRVGQVRVPIKDRISFSTNPVKLYRNKFTLTATNGFLYEIGADGKVQKTNMGLHKEHGMDATSKTLAIMDDNVLKIRSNKTALELGVYTPPTIFYLNDKIYVSVTDLQNQKVYLLDSQSKSIPNFPIYGMSTVDMADMDNDKKPELVVQDQENGIAVYKIN